MTCIYISVKSYLYLNTISNYLKINIIMFDFAINTVFAKGRYIFYSLYCYFIKQKRTLNTQYQIIHDSVTVIMWLFITFIEKYTYEGCSTELYIFAVDFKRSNTLTNKLNASSRSTIIQHVYWTSKCKQHVSHYTTRILNF